MADMDLPTVTYWRLRAAGITDDDPGLRQVREWNAMAYQRAGMTDPHGGGE